MVCYLFIGSWTFSSVFSYLGGHEVIEHWVLAANLNATGFLILAQFIIFLLGWPLEWTEIIIIFVPIFLPLVKTFHIDPTLFGILVALNIQTSFNTPPMAMAAYYLKGVAPPHVRLNQIFAGALPFVFMVFLTMTLVYIFPGIALWLPASSTRTDGGRWRSDGAHRDRGRRADCRRRYLRARNMSAPVSIVSRRSTTKCTPSRISIRKTRWRRRAALDERRRNGQPIGPLHGVPVAIKDIFDTADYKTECGSPLLKGRQPMRDCTAVARLRAAGAVIIGKTVTTEFAYFHPGADPQSARSRTHAGRLVFGLGGGGRGRHGAARDRLADQRLGDPAGVLLRRLWLQAHARTYFARTASCRCRARSIMSAYLRARSPTPR